MAKPARFGGSHLVIALEAPSGTAEFASYHVEDVEVFVQTELETQMVGLLSVVLWRFPRTSHGVWRPYALPPGGQNG